MRDLTRLLRESLPEIIGGLIVAAILAILASLYSLVGLWIVPAIAALLALAVMAWVWASRRRKGKLSEHVTSPTAKPTSPQFQTSSNHKQTILFVDDDIEIIGFGFIAPLEREGFEVIAATNVSQATQILQSNQHLDLIVTDLIMPHGSEKRGESQYLGLEVIETARRLRRNIPIVCLSVAGHNKEVGQRLRELGVIEHLAKPILPSEFIERVKLNLLLSQGPSQQELILDEIRRRKLETKSGNPYNRIRALWALGELGHHDPTILNLLQDISEKDDDGDVQLAARQALSKIREKLSETGNAG